jgi:16S rRNA processing protein RimM
VVGEVTRPHGVRGAVRVLPVTDFPERLLRLRKVAVVRGGRCRTLAVEHAAPAGRFVAMKLAGVDTAEAAAALRGATIEIPAAEAAPLPPGQFYVFQIVGLRARTPAGEPLGEVVDVLRTGSNDVYVVRSAAGAEMLLPAVEGVIEAIDLAAGEVVARPPEWA